MEVGSTAGQSWCLQDQGQGEARAISLAEAAASSETCGGWAPASVQASGLGPGPPGFCLSLLCLPGVGNSVLAGVDSFALKFPPSTPKSLGWPACLTSPFWRSASFPAGELRDLNNQVFPQLAPGQAELAVRGLSLGLRGRAANILIPAAGRYRENTCLVGFAGPGLR